MADYIDRQVANNAFCQHECGLNKDQCDDEYCNGIEAYLSLSDVQSIVRCKDCRYGHRFFDIINGVIDSWVECRNPDGLNRDVSEDSFCSYGGRQDG